MNNQKVKHVVGISGGKDSAALALYLKSKYSHYELPIEYFTCDTGRELDETYTLIKQLEAELGTEIKRYASIDHRVVGEESPFDFFLRQYGGFLPSQNARWCTKKMKLEPFEKEVGDMPVISYVGIRGDEDREGYISTKPNIQSIFPFRKNIWDMDITVEIFNNNRIDQIVSLYEKHILDKEYSPELISIIKTPTSKTFTIKEKFDSTLNKGVVLFNKVVFDYLKTTNRPVGKLDYFPLVNNNDVIIRKDVYEILERHNVDLPRYYLPIEYEVDGEVGKYFRSRSGCFFCFYQQKIEWVWLLEQHPDLFWKAESYEKDGYSWMQNESLRELSNPDRVLAIKREHLKRMKRKFLSQNNSTDWQNQILGIQKTSPLELAKDKTWLDNIIEAEGDLCANCFI